MLRTHNCGELRLTDKGQKINLSGWVQRSRDLGGMTFIDLRDRYGLTQLVFNMETNAPLCEEARKWGREFVIQIEGLVEERSNKNPKMPTGDIEIIANKINILNKSMIPPFTIEDKTDGGEELRMKYHEMDPSQEYLTYCTNDSRGMVAAFLMSTQGLNAKNLRGGLSGWEGPVAVGSDGIHFPQA